MILLVDLSDKKRPLLRDEFVRPVAQIVGRSGAEWTCCHFTEVDGQALAGCGAVILCGTALKDRSYLDAREHFSWLRDAVNPVLGICAGMQVISLACGGIVYDCCEIGMVEVKTLVPHPLLPPGPQFSAFELHSIGCTAPPGWRVLALSQACIQAFCHPVRPLFGVMFHPEVRNEGVVERFLCRAGEGTS
ncbi:MAG: glutamine amidotransferase [Methanolinea sp.]|nr:glutamine amidotransferase [Methanolinea sp.]